MFNFKIKPIYLIAAVLVVAVIITLLAVFIPKSEEIQYNIIKNGISLDGTIVRSETTESLNEYEKLDYGRIIEGQYIEDDSVIVKAYKRGYIKSTVEKLEQTEKSIVTYQNQTILKNNEDKKIDKFDFEISVLIRKMSEENTDLIEMYTKLCSVIKERRDYITTTYLSEANTYLAGLYKDEENLQASIDSWCDTVKAQQAGYISFYCDGREDKLTPEAIDTLTPKMLGASDEKTGTYKLITSEKWYIAVPYTGNTELLQQGMYYSVFIDNSDAAETGCLEKIIGEKRNTVLVFSFEDNVEKYLDKRDVTVLVGERFEGFTIKNKYIKDSSVIVKDAEGKKNVPVEILYQDNEITLFQKNDQLKVGQKVYLK